MLQLAATNGEIEPLTHVAAEGEMPSYVLACASRVFLSLGVLQVNLIRSRVPRTGRLDACNGSANPPVRTRG